MTFESLNENAAAFALKQADVDTHTDTNKPNGGLETEWECLRLRFPK